MGVLYLTYEFSNYFLKHLSMPEFEEINGKKNERRKEIWEEKGEGERGWGGGEKKIKKGKEEGNKST